MQNHLCGRFASDGPLNKNLFKQKTDKAIYFNKIQYKLFKYKSQTISECSFSTVNLEIEFSELAG